jgi:ribosomal protein S19E (S16A)
MLDKTDATKLLTKIRRQWFAKRKSIAAILKEVMTNEAVGAHGQRRLEQGGRRRHGAAGTRRRLCRHRPM